MESSTLRFGKRVDAIEKPILLPDDWYTVQVIKKPKVVDNAAKKADKDSEDAGENWVVDIRVVSKDPTFSGREFSLFFPLPRPGDEERYDRNGQRLEDAKMERIVKFIEKFGGDVGEETVTLGVGCRGGIHIQQRIDSRTGEIGNNPDMFGGFKSVSEL